MPRQSKGARLYLRRERRDGEGNIIEQARWIIRDGSARRSTGCGPGEREEAERRLAEYISQKYSPARTRDRHPSQIPVADVISIYLEDKAPEHARPEETGTRAIKLLAFWGDKMLSEVTGQNCRKYAERRGSMASARRELQDLRSAIRYHHKEGLCAEEMKVTMPDAGASRERWLTRSEAARIIWGAWRFREAQKGRPTGKRSRRHIARFCIVALYTGTRAGAICEAALGEPEPGRGWIDLERGIYYRRGSGARETKKRRPAIPLPDRLVAHLRRWHRGAMRQREVWAVEGDPRADTIPSVVEFNGRPIKRIERAFGRVVADAGLRAGEGEEKITPHTLRHTAATWLMQAGVDKWEIAGYLGMSLETLERVYGHHHPAHLQAARNAITKKPTGSFRAVSAGSNENILPVAK